MYSIYIYTIIYYIVYIFVTFSSLFAQVLNSPTLTKLVMKPPINIAPRRAMLLQHNVASPLPQQANRMVRSGQQIIRLTFDPNTATPPTPSSAVVMSAGAVRQQIVQLPQQHAQQQHAQQIRGPALLQNQFIVKRMADGTLTRVSTGPMVPRMVIRTVNPAAMLVGGPVVSSGGKAMSISAVTQNVPTMLASRPTGIQHISQGYVLTEVRVITTLLCSLICIIIIVYLDT